MIKKTISALLVIVLLSGNIMVAENVDVSSYRPFDMCIAGEDTFCFAAKDTLIEYRGRNIVNALRCEGITLCDAMDGTVYVLCETDDGIVIAAYRDGAIQPLYSVTLDDKVIGFAMYSDRVCLLTQSSYQHEGRLYYYYTGTDVLEEQEQYYDVYTLSASGDTIAFVCYDMFGAILAVEYPGEGVNGVAAEYPPDGDVYLIPGEDACVFLNDTGIEYVAWIDGEYVHKTMAYAQAGTCAMLADNDANGIYMYDTAHDEMLFVDYGSVKGINNRTLVVANLGTSDMERYTLAVNETFAKDHPEYRVESRFYADDNQLKLSLMSGDSDIDVLKLSVWRCFETIHSGLFEDLNEYDCITRLIDSEEFSQWPFRFMRGSDGVLYTLPDGSNDGHILRIETRLFDKLGIAVPDESWTWDDLLRIAREVKEKDSTLYALDLGSYEMLLQYMVSHIDIFTGVADMDTPEFRRLLDIFKALREEEHVRPFDDMNADALFTESSVSSIFDARDVAAEFITYPRMNAGSEAMMSYGGGLMGIYSASDEKQAAAEYIATYYTLPLDDPDCVNAYQAEFPLFYAAASVYMNNGYRGEARFASPENAVKALEYMQHATFGIGMQRLYSDIGPICIEYADGLIDIDRAVAEIVREVDIRLNE